MNETWSKWPYCEYPERRKWEIESLFITQHWIRKYGLQQSNAIDILITSYSAAVKCLFICLFFVCVCVLVCVCVKSVTLCVFFFLQKKKIAAIANVRNARLKNKKNAGKTGNGCNPFLHTKTKAKSNE